MINELVNSILQAEEKAEQISREGAEKSAAVVASAEAEAAEIRKAAERALKQESESLLKQYSDGAEQSYRKTVDEGNARADKIKEEYGKDTDKLSDEIVRWIVSGNC